jgi:hypothetical protein
MYTRIILLQPLVLGLKGTKSCLSDCDNSCARMVLQNVPQTGVVLNLLNTQFCFDSVVSKIN